MQFILLALKIIVFIIADFVLWKKLREEYKDEEILRLTIYIMMFGIAGYYLRYYLEGSGILLAVVLALYLWSKRNKWEFWEILDIVAPILMFVWFGVTFMFVALGALAVLIFVKGNYRKFRWYKSGKMGLVGLTGILLYGLYEIGVAFSGQSGIYLGSLKISQIVSAFIVSYTGVAIYLRSDRKLKEELWHSRKNK